ncbi:MAG: hypothetical protein AB8B50_07820 [Pirellulaceae bacterium]
MANSQPTGLTQGTFQAIVHYSLFYSSFASILRQKGSQSLRKRRLYREPQVAVQQQKRRQATNAATSTERSSQAQSLRQRATNSEDPAA